MTTNEKIMASVEIINTGNFDGKEVVQLYIRDVVGSVTRPVKELKGFQKIYLNKGEKKTVTFEISIEDLKFYNSEIEFVAEPGMFDVYIGTNSDSQERESFELLK
jgi:beta-glucosidase